ncbi:hypothetical protein EZV62_008197 [Acer yangbiense]|uniref:Uncharacterized protein n=1 Tax=Acer yangbiense TaxID=1000413 RepID=A0A5C7IDH3_9ROSI|nr:hypothetical protein EZV62_008197 [Acer yangbiense]
MFSPSLATNLLQLEELFISYCGELVQICIEDDAAEYNQTLLKDHLQSPLLFPNLSSIDISNCGKLKSMFPVSIAHLLSLQNLTTLELSNCDRLTHLFSSTFARNLLQLESIDIMDCKELEQIIVEDHTEDDHVQLGLFPNLSSISVYGCGKLKTLFPAVTIARSGLQKLRTLYISESFHLEELFGHRDEADMTSDDREMVLPRLEELTLQELASLINFCHVGYHFIFPSLSWLEVTECPKLTTRFLVDQNRSVHTEAEIFLDPSHDNSTNKKWPSGNVFSPRESHLGVEGPKDFISLSLGICFSQIMEALKNDKINMVGLYGMGGGQIAESLDVKLNEELVERRAQRLCLRLRNEKKILIIMDDVWRMLDLTTIGIPFGDDHKGCTILLLLVNKKGLPIAIITIGNALREKTIDDWKDVSKKLKISKFTDIETVDQNVYAYQIELRFLEGRENKVCFLLCSLFPEDYEIDLEVLLRYGLGLDLYGDANTIEEARRQLRATINNLKASCLLLDAKEGFVKMHDLVRDVPYEHPRGKMFSWLKLA